MNFSKCIIYGDLTEEISNFIKGVFLDFDYRINNEILKYKELNNGVQASKIHLPIEIEYNKETNSILRVSIANKLCFENEYIDKVETEYEKNEFDTFDRNGLISNKELRTFSHINENVMFLMPMLCLKNRDGIECFFPSHINFFN